MVPKKRSGLGRGLDALIPGREPKEEPPVSVPGGVREIPIGDISPNPRQPRSRFDRSELVELAASIQEVGIIQPLIVTEAEIRGHFVLIAGERRLQAARLAGLQSVPSIVREATDRQMLELALVENVQRADLNPVETAIAYRQLAEDFQMSHDEIARQVGKSRVAVTNTLRLLNVTMPVLQALLDRKITEGHARALLGLETESAQEAALALVLKNGYTVRQTEDMVRRRTVRKAVTRPKKPEIKALEDDLRTRLGTRVTLKHNDGRGSLTIYFYSEEELNTLVDQLLDD
ncbi:MAG TPA: ParB/RepB/Spo0J family partition protein [Anaerolineales bacterium]|nr:ParB/RepB/Spo0J family partition protein [Anaerolineales bacterium]